MLIEKKSVDKKAPNPVKELVANPGIGYGASGYEENEVEDEFENIDDVQAGTSEIDPEIKNTGVGPGEHPDLAPGADVDAASG